MFPNMRFEDCRLYKAITDVPFHRVASRVHELIEERRDLRITSPEGSTFLHVACAHPDKFNNPRALPAVYSLCLAGLNVNAIDIHGETALHKLMRQPGVWRIAIALIRCGADPSMKNSKGQTAMDVLKESNPQDMNITQHWLTKFSPGVENLLKDPLVNTHRLEQLMKCWCRAKTWKNGKVVNLWEVYSNLPSCMVDALRLHAQTNDLALYTMAANVNEVKSILKKGGANINTQDHSYHLQFPQTPQVNQPLIAASWASENKELVDVLMSHAPDTSILYSNIHGLQPEPLFFHVLSGQPRVSTVGIVCSVFRKSDLSKRNFHGETILFEAMKERMPPSFLLQLLQFGANLASRDILARTPRDFAHELGRQDYVDLIDDYVFQLLANRNVKAVKKLLLDGYDHIYSLLTRELCQVAKLNAQFEEDRHYRDIGVFVKDIPRQQKMIGRLFYRIELSDIEAAKRIVGEGDLWKAANTSGRTILHKALLAQNQEVATKLLKLYPGLATMTDNMGSSPLHFACLQFGREHDLIDQLIRLGAKWTTADVRGRTPSDFIESKRPAHEYAALRMEIMQAESKVFLRRNNFEKKLKKVIKSGSVETMKNLLECMSPHVHLPSYSDWLFKCIEYKQPSIAAHLIKCGCDADIWTKKKIREKGASGESQTETVSLHDYAKTKGYNPLANFIEKVNNYRKSKDEFGQQTPSPFESMDHFGNA